MIKTTEQQFKKLLASKEDSNLEFKKAQNDFSKSKDLPNYCAALANEGGGKLILGISDDRRITGTKAFENATDSLPHYLLELLGIRVDVEECVYVGKRILIFHIPSRPQGKPIKSNGLYFMRAGSSLMAMDEATLKNIFSENAPDFSASIVPGLTVNDMDEKAIAVFKKRWSQKQKLPKYLEFSTEKTLRAIVAADEKGGITFAALILFGKKEKIDRLLPCAEISYEWRIGRTIAHDFRKNWREPFFAVYDDIWSEINNRNIRFPYQEGFIQREIFAFSEEPIREAVLNAVAHRDYAIQSNWIFIKASPEEFRIESPGGFLPGITADNIITRRAARNKLICEIFEKAGLVERAGQGMDLIFETTAREGKGFPSFDETDAYQVVVHIPAQVKDAGFVKFLEKIANEKQISFSAEEVIDLEKIREHGKLRHSRFVKKFLEYGIVEKMGKTKGVSYMLSHKYYMLENKTGVYTRIAGLSRDEKKELILKHIVKNKKGYKKDFTDVFPDISDQIISTLLHELKIEGKIIHKGSRKSGCWEAAN